MALNFEQYAAKGNDFLALLSEELELPAINQPASYEQYCMPCVIIFQ